VDSPDSLPDISLYAHAMDRELQTEPNQWASMDNCEMLRRVDCMVGEREPIESSIHELGGNRIVNLKTAMR
jgi:hypothetical protein